MGNANRLTTISEREILLLPALTLAIVGDGVHTLPARKKLVLSGQTRDVFMGIGRKVHTTGENGGEKRGRNNVGELLSERAQLE